MEINSSLEHETMAFDYQILEIDRLNNLLKKFGVTDKEVRQEICSEYAFENSYFLDAGWFEHEGKRLYPQICFAERKSDPNENLGEIEMLHIPSEEYDLHESAHANDHWYFEEHQENAGEIATSSYQQQDETE